MAFHYIIIAVLMMAAVFKTGGAIKCYVCHPSNNDNCEDNYGRLQDCSDQKFEDVASHATSSLDRKTLVDTLFAEVMCAKITFKSGFGGFDRIYMRTCMPSVEKLCPSKVEALTYLSPETRRNFGVSCRFCGTDGCNGANVPVISPLLALSFLILIKIFS